MSASQFDYIIVGAGSAGCVLANRLSADRSISILVLEAGPQDRSLYALRMPAALAVPLQSQRYNWDYWTDPEPCLDGRRLSYPRGRVIGGSSSINGMVYLRGNPLDYDAWAGLRGLEDWSFAHCLPYFKRMETSALGPSDFRGGDGPLKVTIPDCDNPLFQAFLAAGVQAGYARTQDVNGFRQEGFYRMERSTHGGVRSSAARAYLHPASRERGNIQIRPGGIVTRIVFSGRRAVGIDYLHKGAARTAHAAREVIVAAGAINTPALLKLSGIGPAPELRGHDIPVVLDLPGVGENLQDHLDLLIQYRCMQPISWYPATKRLRQIGIGLEWLLFKTGTGASNIWEAGSFFRSRAGVAFPNLQHHFAPIAISYDGAERIEGHGYQVHLSQMRPRSRGAVRLRSKDPLARPSIVFNHLADAEDRQELRDGIRLTREVMMQSAFAPFRGAEIAPGIDTQSDAAIDAFARAKVETSHHPSCTCKMGSDPLSVVDGVGRVHELEGLRIVDASIMPNVVSANINAPTIMMAEKLADRISARPPLPPEPTPFFRATSYHASQR